MKAANRQALYACLFVLGATNLGAQDQANFTLNDGAVRFHAPAAWTAVMEKKDGDPQAIAFQVPDPSTDGSEDAATVTVKTRQLADAAGFAAAVQEEFERARQQPGFATDPANKDASVRQYFVSRGKTRYLVRDRARLVGRIAAEVRCQRPLLASTPAAWNAQFDRDCDAVTASLGP